MRIFIKICGLALLEYVPYGIRHFLITLIVKYLINIVQ
jgi:hypothetical protein